MYNNLVGEDSVGVAKIVQLAEQEEMITRFVIMSKIITITDYYSSIIIIVIYVTINNLN